MSNLKSLFETAHAVDDAPSMDEVFSESLPVEPGEHPGMAFLIPPLCDVFFEKTAYVWMRLVSSGVSSMFEPEFFSTDFMGGEPEWFDEYRDGLGYMLIRHGEDGGLVFALENGLAPGQPFLVECDIPRYSYDYWTGEADADYDFEIVRKMPAPNPAASFERTIDRALRGRAWAKDKLERLIKAQRNSPKHMFIRAYHYNGYFNPPSAYRFRLESSLRWPTMHNNSSLVYAEAETYDAALALLAKKAFDELDLDEGFVRSLTMKW